MSTYTAIKHALHQAKEYSTMHLHQLGCVILDKSRVVSASANQSLPSGATSLHAEQGAIEQLMRQLHLLPVFRRALMRGKQKPRELHG